MSQTLPSTFTSLFTPTDTPVPTKTEVDALNLQVTSVCEQLRQAKITQEKELIHKQLRKMRSTYKRDMLYSCLSQASTVEYQTEVALYELQNVLWGLEQDKLVHGFLTTPTETLKLETFEGPTADEESKWWLQQNLLDRLRDQHASLTLLEKNVSQLLPFSERTQARFRGIYEPPKPDPSGYTTFTPFGQSQVTYDKSALDSVMPKRHASLDEWYTKIQTASEKLKKTSSQIPTHLATLKKEIETLEKEAPSTLSKPTPEPTPKPTPKHATENPPTQGATKKVRTSE